MALVVSAIGLAVLPLETSLFTRVLVGRVSVAGDAGLTPQQTAFIAEQVRAFVVEREGALPAVFAGVPAFDAAMVGHLEDVASVLALAQVATAASLLVVAALAVWLWRRGRGGLLGRTLVTGGAAGLVSVVVAGAIALIDFDGFFTLFHRLFFAQGTWTFPWDSLLIRLFPEAFWAVAGLSWGLGIMLISAAYVFVGRTLRSRA